jgi:hypothetical protein
VVISDHGGREGHRLAEMTVLGVEASWAESRRDVLSKHHFLGRSGEVGLAWEL